MCKRQYLTLQVVQMLEIVGHVSAFCGSDISELCAPCKPCVLRDHLNVMDKIWMVIFFYF